MAVRRLTHATSAARQYQRTKAFEIRSHASLARDGHESPQYLQPQWIRAVRGQGHSATIASRSNMPGGLAREGTAVSKGRPGTGCDMGELTLPHKRLLEESPFRLMRAPVW